MTVCAWCDDVITRTPAEAAGVSATPAVSHGICRSCLSDALTKLRPSIAPTPVFAPSPALG